MRSLLIKGVIVGFDKSMHQPPNYIRNAFSGTKMLNSVFGVPILVASLNLHCKVHFQPVRNFVLLVFS